MRHLMILVVAGALLVSSAATSEAQVSVSVGNPYTGQGVFIGTPAYGTGFGYPAYGVNTVGRYSAFPGYAAGGYYPGYGVGFNRAYTTSYLGGPGAFGYSSGYRGVSPALGAYGYGYGVRPGFGGYGYGGYGYRPYRPFGRFR